MGGTLVNILGQLAITSYTPNDAYSLVLDDSGNTNLTPRLVTLNSTDAPAYNANYIEGLAPARISWNQSVGSAVNVRGGAGDETFAIKSNNFAAAVSIDGGGGVNTLDYSSDTSIGISGLVAWYPGEGNTNDIAGGNNGIPIGQLQYVPGKVGQAFSISGDGTDYVQVPDSPNLEPTNVSVEAWVKSSGVGENQYLISKGAFGNNVASYALYTGYSSGLLFYISDGSNYIESPDAGAGIWDNQWHHVVGTFDGGTVRLFVDGSEVGNGTPTDLKIGYGLPTTNDLLIGNYVGINRVFPFEGQIDEPSVYNRAISAAEVGSLFAAGSAGKSNLQAGVVVNLELGTATGLVGGIAKIQNVIGTAGNDILVGNGGNVLSGGLGRNLLIAGSLASTLIGGGDQDILIGGTTNYDKDPAALTAIMTEWASGTDYSVRVANLKNGTNGVPILNTSSARSNHRLNMLFGKEDLDFFFANLQRDTLDREPLIEQLVTI